jgi:Flp pilus assembly pilin Flp
MLKRFIKQCSGATAIEYALIAMLVSVATIGGIRAVGEANKANMNAVAEKFPNIN